MARSHFAFWKASNSIPDYRAQAAEKLFVLELDAVRPPGTLAQILNLMGYPPVGAPMMALPGQTVCRNEFTI
jgi:hypothetical protein